MRKCGLGYVNISLCRLTFVYYNSLIPCALNDGSNNTVVIVLAVYVQKRLCIHLMYAALNHRQERVFC